MDECTFILNKLITVKLENTSADRVVALMKAHIEIPDFSAISVLIQMDRYQANAHCDQERCGHSNIRHLTHHCSNALEGRGWWWFHLIIDFSTSRHNLSRENREATKRCTLVYMVM